MENRWKDKDAEAAIKLYADVSEDVALRVYTSRLIGAEPALVLHGGGNTSVKSRTKNRLGEEIEVLYVKGSGWDLDTLEPPGLPGVQLDYLKQLRNLPSLSDEAMVNDQRTHLLDASSPNPSVETLLHAFLPHKFIDHSHADSILVIANQPNSEKICKEIYGDELGVVSYIMPGFDLAKAAAEAYEENPKVKGLVLINHGLFTFGKTAKESYDAHIKAVTQAETYIKNNPRQPLTPANDSGSANDVEILKAIAPALRGLYRERSGNSWLVHHRESGAAREFASSQECNKWSQIGTATPDHVIRTKQKPLLLDPKHLDDPERLRSELKEALERYEKAYHKYFVTNQAMKDAELKELDPLPRVILVAGLGLVTMGKTVKETKISADLYEHTIEIIQSAFDIGTYQPLKDSDLFDMEYWSLEQAKMGKAQPPLLQGQVAYITGAASGIGRATAHLFAQQGANVYLVDLNDEALEGAGIALQKESKASVTWRGVDLTNDEAVEASFDHAVQTYGGVDILISNAGNAVQGRIGDVNNAILRGSFDLNFFAHQTVAAQAVQIFLQQKTGGTLLFNASKAAFNPGKDFGPYALPKAAVVALSKQYALDYGKDGVRSNAVNADRIRSGMFTDDFIAERSKARGLEPEAYFRENLLEREVLDTDVAKAFLHLAVSEKTTGSVFTVDGGNIAASPR
jgi:rhamnose utilization protein RhaD (predicted bifunctional aldolase and dehydrogenase)/NAD(P)-dependent dehydrogenase (short-subunit alcohol dehydrogenase family)